MVANTIIVDQCWATVYDAGPTLILHHSSVHFLCFRFAGGIGVVVAFEDESVGADQDVKWDALDVPGDFTWIHGLAPLLHSHTHTQINWKSSKWEWKQEFTQIHQILQMWWIPISYKAFCDFHKSTIMWIVFVYVRWNRVRSNAVEIILLPLG